MQRHGSARSETQCVKSGLGALTHGIPGPEIHSNSLSFKFTSVPLVLTPQEHECDTGQYYSCSEVLVTVEELVLE